MKNLSKAYYKDYFKDLKFTITQQEAKAKKETERLISERNEELLRLANADYLRAVNKMDSLDGLANKQFELEVCYPGLVTGIGLNHEAKIEGEFKLGVHFDYTTGLPIVYGSSVKGILRSAFEIRNLLAVLIRLFPKEKRLKDIQEQIGNDLSTFVVDIFGSGKDEKERQEGVKSIYKRDIFFDAVVSGVSRTGKMLEADSITPHKNGPLKNPIPLTFVRIASGCKLKFRFRLTDSTLKKADGNTLKLSAGDKELLFMYILMAFGIGAKTNVGYGRLKLVPQSSNRLC